MIYDSNKYKKENLPLPYALVEGWDIIKDSELSKKITEELGMDYSKWGKGSKFTSSELVQYLTFVGVKYYRPMKEEEFVGIFGTDKIKVEEIYVHAFNLEQDYRDGFLLGAKHLDVSSWDIYDIQKTCTIDKTFILDLYDLGYEVEKLIALLALTGYTLDIDLQQKKYSKLYKALIKTKI